MYKIGVIGLGMIGGGVATCVARHKNLTSVFDIRPDAAAKVPDGPPCAETPAALTKTCDTIFIAVINAQQVRELLIGKDGILAAAKPSLTLILLSTVSLDEFRELAALTNDKGVKLIDCGVTGGPAAASTGDLVCLVGAEENDFDAISPVLAQMSKASFRMGGPGAGMAAKIARNIIVYTTWMAGQEAARLAGAAGVDPLILAEVVNSSDENIGGPTTWLTRISPNEDAQERAIRESVLVLLQKDLSAALELGKQLHVDLPGAEVALSQGAATLAIR
tara:strand:+ start:4391 stop:5221 length:831 start_codon:yes stop_codon:yes gene_type:complete